jgi:hypothetical protein
MVKLISHWYRSYTQNLNKSNFNTVSVFQITLVYRQNIIQIKTPGIYVT